MVRVCGNGVGSRVRYCGTLRRMNAIVGGLLSYTTVYCGFAQHHWSNSTNNNQLQLELKRTRTKATLVKTATTGS